MTSDRQAWARRATDILAQERTGVGPAPAARDGRAPPGTLGPCRLV